MEAETNRMTQKIALIGLGLIGQERLHAIQRLQHQGRDIELIGLYDPYSKEIDRIATQYSAPIYTNLEQLIKTNPDWVIVATPHDVAVEITAQLLSEHCRVFIEKPLGRSLSEANQLVSMTQFPDQLWVGFNYRFYDGITAALQDVKSGVFGDLISIQLVAGYANPPHMKDHWKLDPLRVGGGCLIDPGIHLIDLARLFSHHPLSIKGGVSWQGFWNTGHEEECHLFLNAGEFMINLQVSIVKWVNTFRLEINGTDGYGIVSGRNRHYGKQTYIRGPRWGWLTHSNQKNSEVLILKSDGENSFTNELEALLFPNQSSPIQPCTAQEGLSNMTLLHDALKWIKKTS